ncbi:MAG: bifunctional demethylmenaquinone methyltransferase/2-methoxy-6-polyprenyl-1,4-benzoquinol methylase UbiE [Flavobacteriales bacterium]|nr:bifunctional demethylmenaquinone methyltransferase/2-methoxy-6-polyprenyl-1,4-benzoquinol methylase UbiE [Flavobacteriales bacterium]
MIKPQQNSLKSKKTQVANMFDNIAKNYDFLNHTLSFGMDFYWRKKAIENLTNNPKMILDVATGTADFAIAASKLNKVQITGIDISKNMLEIGKKKVAQKGLEKQINLQLADSENLPFKNESFDAITAGFGVRNFENLEVGLSEMCRVLKQGGIAVILEPSTPKIFPIKQIYSAYFHHILPFFGQLISKDKRAYNYLPESVDAFPENEKFMSILKKVGFSKAHYIPLTLGIVSLYIAIK